MVWATLLSRPKLTESKGLMIQITLFLPKREKLKSNLNVTNCPTWGLFFKALRVHNLQLLRAKNACSQVTAVAIELIL